MHVSFACPSCNATGSVDAVHIGKQVRCKHCGTRFAIPDPENSEPMSMLWKNHLGQMPEDAMESAGEEAVFVRRAQ